jgi:ribosome-associated protein YbcJ (S4-like RNA binding protein)
MGGKAKTAAWDRKVCCIGSWEGRKGRRLGVRLVGTLRGSEA